MNVARRARHAPVVSLVVVASNDEGEVERLVDACAALADAVRPAETVVINDGSVDGTWQEIAAAHDRHRHVGALDLADAYGPVTAMLEGVRRASGDHVCFIDGQRFPSPGALLALSAVCAADGIICATSALATSSRGELIERLRDPEALRELLNHMAQGTVVPFSVSRREAVLGELQHLMPEAPTDRVVGLWYAPGEPMLGSGNGSGALASSGLNPRAARSNARRTAKLAVPAALVGVVLVGSGLEAPRQLPVARIENASAPGPAAVFAEHNPPNPVRVSNGQQPASQTKTTSHESGSGKQRPSRGDASGVETHGTTVGRDTSGGGPASGGSSGSGSGGNGSSGGGNGGSGGSGGGGGSGPGNSHGHGQARGHSHAPGQTKKNDPATTPGAPPRTHGNGHATGGRSADHPHGPPVDHGGNGHGSSKA